jgi:hypothetical protein
MAKQAVEKAPASYQGIALAMPKVLNETPLQGLSMESRLFPQPVNLR